MKIIFLDIDGVLIRFGNTAKIRKTRAEKGKGGIITDLDDDLVKNLLNLVIKTDAFIVLSSSWRRHSSLMEKLRDQFYKYKMPDNFHAVDLWGRVIGKTPCNLGYGRGNEVLSWINKHHLQLSAKKETYIKNWVMIDDDAFDSKCVKRLGKFVHTKTHEGLTEDKMNECIKILNSSI